MKSNISSSQGLRSLLPMKFNRWIFLSIGLFLVSLVVAQIMVGGDVSATETLNVVSIEGIDYYIIYLEEEIPNNWRVFWNLNPNIFIVESHNIILHINEESETTMRDVRIMEEGFRNYRYRQLCQFGGLERC